MSQKFHAVMGASGTRRGLSAFALTVVALAATAAAPQPALAVPKTQAQVRLLRDHAVRTAPRIGAKRTATVEGRRPLTGVRTVLPELGRAVDSHGRSWVYVELLGRPNSSTGWIQASRTRRASTPWRLAVKLSTRKVTVYRYGRVVHRFPAVVGAPSTPTPTGRFFIEEAMSLDSSAAGGPYALATSARSNVLQYFEGGPGQIALHGRNYLYDPLGSAASHGCIRMSTYAITWLTKRIGGGVPLKIKY